MPDALSRRIAFAQHLADAAGAAIRPYFRKKLSIGTKGPAGHYDPVTEADHKAEAAMRDLIIETFPDDAILGEEEGNLPGSSGFRWIIDPIDGTRAFITGITLWGTLIALEQEGRLVLGLLDQPILSERYVGTGGAAHLVTPEGETALHVRPCARIADAVVTATHPFAHFTPEEMVRFDRVARHARLSRFGGDCYAYGLLAMGFIDLVAETGFAPWDLAALIPIVEGAGGIVTDWTGKPLWERPLSADARVSIVAAGDKRVHREAVTMLAEPA